MARGHGPLETDEDRGAGPGDGSTCDVSASESLFNPTDRRALAAESVPQRLAVPITEYVPAPKVFPRREVVVDEDHTAIEFAVPSNSRNRRREAIAID